MRLFDFYLSSYGVCEIIRIYQEFEGEIEKSVLRITFWHHEACRVMTNGDNKGRIFYFDPQTNNELIFLRTIKCSVLCLRLPEHAEIPEYAEMWHGMMTSL